MYTFKENYVIWNNETKWKINNPAKCKIVNQVYLITDEYVFFGSNPIFKLNKNNIPIFLNPEKCKFHNPYVYDDKMIFIGTKYLCNINKAQFLEHGFLATNTRIYHFGKQQTFLVKKLGCNPKEISVINGDTIKDNSYYYKYINAVGEPWIKQKHASNLTSDLQRCEILQVFNKQQG